MIRILIILFLLVSCAPKTIGPIIWTQQLGMDMVKFGIDKNEDGIIDHYETYIWSGKRLVLVETEMVEDEPL